MMSKIIELDFEFGWGKAQIDAKLRLNSLKTSELLSEMKYNLSEVFEKICSLVSTLKLNDQ